MAQEYIEIRGARENNLKNVSMRIPKRKITIFTGVSGSGKSSIVFDTIANESQRLLTENFSMFLRNFMPRYPQPDADSIENLSMAVAVDQKRLGGGPHSTLGTITDTYTLLRLLFSRAGTPHAGSPSMFLFNDPSGMCPECGGVGRTLGVIADSFWDPDKSLNEGALHIPVVSWWKSESFKQCGFFDNDKKLSEYTKEEMEPLLHGKDRKYTLKGGGKTKIFAYEGIVECFTSVYLRRDMKTMPERTQAALAPYISMGPCSLCHGTRLSQAALASKIDGRNIADFTAMEIGELLTIVAAIKDPEVTNVVKTLSDRLGHLIDMGLGYLSLDRETDTLSGGESQRVKMVKHISGSLVDATYIFDEPSIGLHPRDVHQLNELLQKLRDKGNTVIVVEHDPAVIKVADHIVDVGPRAGTGGQIVFEGTYSELLKADTLTGTHLEHALPIKPEFRKPTGQLSISHATIHNLQDMSVRIPTGVLSVVTGVAGSGKSSLINHVFLREHPEAIVIDQSAVGISTRSNPATYTGIMDDLRKAFAAANKVDAVLFSFNSKGACENCQGLGVVYTDLGFLDGVKLPCEVCEGKRFKDEVLAYTLHGKSISEVLGLTVAQALEYIEHRDVSRKLQAMRDVGLDYLSLGQPLSTLSGGECQRLKLASELHKKGSIYVLDEPTTGLHMSDITHLLDILNRLVDSGNSVVVIEHNLDVIRNADWVIDMGPGGGNKCGTVVFEGTPKELLSAEHSLTSHYLR